MIPVFLLLTSVEGSQDSLTSRNKVLAEALRNTVEMSFNGLANFIGVSIETDHTYNKIYYIDLFESVIKMDWNHIYTLNINAQLYHSIGECNLWLIDSYESFSRLFNMIHSSHTDSQVFFLIVLKTNEPAERIFELMEKIFSDMITMMIANVNVMVQSSSSNEVLFYTYFPFEESVCRSTKPILISTFVNMSLSNRLLFPPKVDNFYGCSIHLVTRNPTFFNKVRRIKGFLELSGLEHEIIYTLAAKMHLTLDFIGGMEYASPDVLSNGSLVGPFKTLKEGKCDIIVGSYKHGILQDRVLTPSITYFTNWMVIALIRPQREFSKLSWLFESFDLITWIWILVILLINAILIIIAVNTTSIVRYLKMPPQSPRGLNALAIVVGMPILDHLPSTNFLRFYFITWSLGALIVRATYQGKLFDSYCRLRMTTKSITIKKLLSENYTLHSHLYYKPILNDISGIGNFNYKQLTPWPVFNDTTEKNALIASFSYMYSVYEEKELRSMMMETVLPEHICLFFQKHSVLVPKVNRIIERMDEVGLLLPWKRHYETLKNNIFYPPDALAPGPTPIVLSRFKYSLYIFVGSLMIALVVFVIELAW